MILRHAPRYPESMVRLLGIYMYPINPAELASKSAENQTDTVPKPEFDLRGHRWPLPWAAFRKSLCRALGRSA